MSPLQTSLSSREDLFYPSTLVEVNEEDSFTAVSPSLSLSDLMGSKESITASSQPQTQPQPCGSPKQKNSSRRNAWGNFSYADLITQAIQNSPEKRLTLAQIYEWVVENVPYFSDKGDSASSSGWKVT